MAGDFKRSALNLQKDLWLMVAGRIGWEVTLLWLGMALGRPQGGQHRPDLLGRNVGEPLCVFGQIGLEAAVLSDLAARAGRLNLYSHFGSPDPSFCFESPCNCHVGGVLGVAVMALKLLKFSRWR